MMGRLPRSVPPLAWRGLLVLGAALALGVELAVPWEQAPDMTPHEVAALGQEPPRPATPAPGVYASIAERPLFQPSRAPWTAPPAPRAARAAAAPPDVVLAGVVISDTGRSAIVRSAKAPTTTLVSEGQTLNGWTLRRIDSAGLHFVAGSQVFDLGFPNPRPSVR